MIQRSTHLALLLAVSEDRSFKSDKLSRGMDVDRRTTSSVATAGCTLRRDDFPSIRLCKVYVIKADDRKIFRPLTLLRTQYASLRLLSCRLRRTRQPAQRDYFARFGIAEGLRKLAEDHPFRPCTLAVSATPTQEARRPTGSSSGRKTSGTPHLEFRTHRSGLSETLDRQRQ